MTARVAVRRCAVYTRKSSEEGLEQDFNSLHAQREACEAFICSQRGEGWRLVETAYDDGGLSGGTMERPALQRLLADIAQCRVDTVVVYKVDRLTRSLMDFAKIVELFDRHGVTFVAVTQQFNTTTSMGRLTLNTLLSFAQFEREVIGERVRDKIAASKKKGMWMGGVTPLGYATRDRRLIVVPEEAETVRLIFEGYRELGSVRLLKQDLDAKDIRSKQRSYGNGARVGGQPFSRGALYALLSNPIYIGEIAHKGSRYRGQHEAILDRETWAAVQSMLSRGPGRRRTTTSISSPLAGKLFDVEGERLTPSHAVKQGRRYRYYVSRSLIIGAKADSPQGWRIPAAQLERLVAHEAAALLSDKGAIAAAVEQASLPGRELQAVFAAADRCREQLTSQQGAGAALATLIDRVELGTDRLHVSVALAVETSASGRDAAVRLVRDIPLCIKRRGVEMRLVIENAPAPAAPDPILIHELRRAHRCVDRLVMGRVTSLDELATQEGVSDRYISSVLPLAFLAPDILEAIVNGCQPPELTAHRLIRSTTLPIAWRDQKRLLGIR